MGANRYLIIFLSFFRLPITMTRNKKNHTETAASDATSPETDRKAVSTSTDQPGDTPTEAFPEDLGEKLQAALATSEEQYVRLMADFDNFRKRVARERSETIKRANQDIVADILPVIDHFELAIQQVPDANDPFVIGVKMVYDQLIAALSKSGLEPIDAQGQAFDPAIHEAIATQPSADVDEGYVLFQTRRGYRLSDYVIRPTSVIVSSGASQPAPETGPETGDASIADAAADEAADASASDEIR